MLYKKLKVNKDGENRVVKVYNYNYCSHYKCGLHSHAVFYEQQMKRLEKIEKGGDYNSAVDLFKNDKEFRKLNIKLGIFMQALFGLGAALLAFNGAEIPIDLITSCSLAEGLFLASGLIDAYNFYNDVENLNKLK